MLVVDDDAWFRELATRILIGWGHTVVGEAGDVAQALAQAALLKPEVVLVDIGLPDGDGFSLTQHLRAMPHPPQVVLISSDSDRAIVSAAHRAGASGFFPKDELSGAPFRQLLERVEAP